MSRIETNRKAHFCVALPCKNLKFSLVHKFPMKNDRAEEWIRALNNPALEGKDMTQIRKSLFVCSRHFVPSDYKNEFARSLNWNAVPSINLVTFSDKSCTDSLVIDPQPGSVQLQPVLPTQPIVRVTVVEKPPVLVRVHKVITPKKRKIVEMKSVSKVQVKPKDDPLSLLWEETAPMESYRAEEEAATVAQPIASAETMSPSELIEDLFLSVPGLNEKLDYFWLRDHCRCSKCYNHSTNQRKIAIRDIPLDIIATGAKVNGDQLIVEWSGGHSSEYSIKTLSEMLLESRLTRKPKPVLWTVDMIKRLRYARVSMNEYLQDDNVSKSVVQSLVDYGVAFVENVPANSTFTEIVIKRLFAVHRTHFGEMWTFSDSNSGYLDTAYTSEMLPAHTDNTYFNDASGLQVLHCIEYEATGGLSLLVDGFKVLENLKAKHPETYERLKKYQVPAENKDNNAHHKYTAPIIIEDPVDGEPEQIRYNTGDRDVMNTLSMKEMKQFYGDLQKLAAEVENPALEWWFPLQPGTVVMFNNWRLLHGRSEFSGKRVMSGSYVSRTEFMSVARTMGILP